MIEKRVRDVLDEYILNDDYEPIGVKITGNCINNSHRISIEVVKKPPFDFLKEWDNENYDKIEDVFYEHNPPKHFTIRLMAKTDLIVVSKQSNCPVRYMKLTEAFNLNEHGRDAIQWIDYGEYVFNIAKYRELVNEENKSKKT